MMVPSTGSFIVLFIVAAFLFPIYLFFSGDGSVEGKKLLVEENLDALVPVAEKKEANASTGDAIIDNRREDSTVPMNPDRKPEKNNGSAELEKPQTKRSTSREEILTADDLSSNNNWRCACEGGFLPPGMLQSFSGAEAVLRMSSGQCYHKQT